MAETESSWLSLLNVSIFLGLLFFVARRVFFSAPDESVEDEPEPLVFTRFTPATLVHYNGTNDPRVLIAVKGKVYDVTTGKSFYGPGGPYSNFAGRDASRGLAKNSFDDEVLTSIDQPIDTLEDLTDEERKTLNDWAGLFESKYIHCGELVNESPKDK
jgi:membrane-associated progesterone receptor component